MNIQPLCRRACRTGIVGAFLTAIVLSSLRLALGVEPPTVPALKPIRVSADGRGFVFAKSGQPFVPRGVNYDHDRRGRLIEDYWNDDWRAVEEDFGEIRDLGANVVRVHLQFGKFMDAADRPNDAALARLAKLLELAERSRLYLDITGLGCYHKADVPAWYDALDESQRWAAQAAFWQAVAKTCRHSPAVFCYDLMNEPVVAAGKPKDDWLGPAFAGKHFVQYITRDLAGRERPAVAAAWTKTLVAAIRRHDTDHLVTVGLVPWSLDRPGLTSGFVPDKIAPHVDFIAVHLYPETGKLDEALDTLKGFAVGKPVVVEETFALKCSAKEWRTFVDRGEAHAAGWIGFYWGQTIDECRQSGTISGAITAAWLEQFVELTSPSDVPLTDKSAVRFASVDEAAAVLGKRDRFVTAQSPWDRQARLKVDRDVPVEEYLKFAAGEVIAWEAADREKLAAAIGKARERLRPWSLPFPEQVLLIQTTGKEEGRAAYCRENAIVLPRNIVAKQQGESLERLLLHELFHILSSHNETLRERLYAVVGFTPCGAVELPAELAARKITNPDAPTIEHRIELDVDGESVEAVPILLASEVKYDAAAGREFFAYMQFRLLAVAKNEKGGYAARSRDGKPWLLDPADTPSYHEKIGRNTGYIIHPEEIMADNFVLLVRGEEKVKTPRILDAMRTILGEADEKAN